MIAACFPKPYYAVVFTSVRNGQESRHYAAAAQRMIELASQQPGYLGVESVRDASGLGITVSYWASEAAIVAWKTHVEHTQVRQQGRALWYQSFTTRVCKVERDYAFSSTAI